jgi:osmotically-inducible protein OsmY
MNRLAAIAFAALLLAGCSERSNRVDLGVDLYLHPQSGTAEDLILQAAIRKKVLDTVPRNSGIVYVRVIDRIVFLTGSVKSQEIRDLVREAAEKIQ